MKNSRKVLLIIVLALVTMTLFVASVNVAKTVSDDFDFGSDATCSVLVEYYGYYNGERVTIPFVQAPWSINNVVVDSLGVNISWVCSGQYMKWDTLAIVGTLKLYWLNYYGVNPTDITSNVGASTAYSRTGVTAKTGSAVFIIPLSALLSGVSASGVTSAGVSYWTIRAETTVSGTCTDDYNKAWSDATGLLKATYTIYDAAAGFSISGVIK